MDVSNKPDSNNDNPFDDSDDPDVPTPSNVSVIDQIAELLGGIVIDS